MFQAVSGLVNNIWWILFTARLAFGANHPKLNWLDNTEHILDGIFLVEIISIFFIGIPIDETSYQADRALDSKNSYNHNMKEIAIKYLMSTLIFDLVSLIPTFTRIEYSSLYYIKIVRIVH